ELLLAHAERAAWQPRQDSKSQIENRKLVDTCHAVSRRAAQTLKWAMQLSQGALLTIALEHLTLGRAALYAAILEQSAIQNLKSELAQAVTGLRRAGTTHHLPRGPLPRAWLRYLVGAWTGAESAQSDLDEAWDVAARGPMPLFLADIHLYRARLFRRK